MYKCQNQTEMTVKNGKQTNLKSDSHLPKKNYFICFNERPLKMMKNVFYFILKDLFVLRTLRFFS